MSVHQLKDGRWFVRFPKGTIDTEPLRTRYYFGRGEDAQVLALQKNADMGFGLSVVDSGQTIPILAKYYLTARMGVVEQKSILLALMHIEKHFVPFFGNTDVTNITDEHIDKYVAQRLGEKWKDAGGQGAKRVGVTRSTIKRELTTLQAILNLAAKRKLITHNPIKYYTPLKTDDAIISPPTATELRIIMAHAVPHLKRFITIAHYTAVRPGLVELLRLKWDAVDFAGQTINITSARKGGLKARRLSLHPALFSSLESWYEEDEKRKTMPETIIHYHGAAVKKIDKAWSTAKKKGKILRRLRPYDIRHGSVTEMLESGADLKAVSLIAGHASPTTTMRTYQHVSSALQRQAVTSVSTLVTLGNTDEETNKTGR